MGKKSGNQTDNKINIRALALETLLELESEGAKCHVLLKAVLDKYDYLSRTDKNFLKRLVEGTTEYKLMLDHVISFFSRTQVEKIKLPIKVILRMSLYQHIYMDRVPDSAICNEAVKLAGKKGFAGLKGYVNGVLRNTFREYDNVTFPDPVKDTVAYLSIKYSCPEHIVKGLMEDYGKEEAERSLEASLKTRDCHIRLDERLGADGLNRLRHELEAAGVVSEADTTDDDITFPDYAVRVKDTEAAVRYPGFTQGSYTIQDVSSMLVCEAAFGEWIKRHPLPYDEEVTILDLCAAPGGKSLHAVSKLSALALKGKVYSRDVSELKLDLIRSSIERMRCSDVMDLKVADATVFDPEMEKKADIVLADVPCSGLGVIGRKPDIKYHLKEQVLNDLPLLQRSIILNAIRYVKPGGILVYSTCTMRKAENEDNRDAILKNEGFELIWDRQLFIRESHDGFYTAVFGYGH